MAAKAGADHGAGAFLHDPVAVQILLAEYSSLNGARSLVYNEAFTRGAMFLSFLSMSLVGIALVAQAVPLDRTFVVVAAVVLAVDLVVGLTTYGRIVRANYEDYLAIQRMARIRHAFGELAPTAVPYLSGDVHDDLEGVMVSYGSPPVRGWTVLVYQLTTSSMLVALIDSVVAGVLAAVIGLLAGASAELAFAIAAVSGLGTLVALGFMTARFFGGIQASLPVRFPRSQDGSADRA